MSKPFSIAMGCDEAAYELKEVLKKYIQQDMGYEVEDLGTVKDEQVLYPDIALKVANAIVKGSSRLGVLACGTGIGVSITANKVPGIRAAQAHDTYSAERARKSNDAQIVCLGARVVGPELAKSIVKAFIESDFQGGGSAAKVERITAIEQELREERAR
jgi:ribose 5-phosphate isomerase B